MTRTDTPVVWLLRAAWVTLPLTSGGALSDALTSWSDPSRAVAATLLWSAWGLGSVALFAPRPAGLTFVRAAAPVVLVVIVVASRDRDTEAMVAVAVAGLTFVLALAPPFAFAAANGPAYGDEIRFPLRIPPALFFAPLPLAVLVVATGVATGPLLLGAQRWGWGLLATALGLPLAAIAARSLHGLSRRWAVLVPAGVVLADPATLDDPVLFRTERISELRPVEAGARPSGSVVDLRLGANRGGVELVLNAETDMLLVRRGRNRSELAPTRTLWFCVQRRDRFLGSARGRRPMADSGR